MLLIGASKVVDFLGGVGNLNHGRNGMDVCSNCYGSIMVNDGGKSIFSLHSNRYLVASSGRT